MAVRSTSPGKLYLWEDAMHSALRIPPSTKKVKALQKEPQEEGTNETRPTDKKERRMPRAPSMCYSFSQDRLEVEKEFTSKSR